MCFRTLHYLFSFISFPLSILFLALYIILAVSMSCPLFLFVNPACFSSFLVLSFSFCHSLPHLASVIPAKAGIQYTTLLETSYTCFMKEYVKIEKLVFFLVVRFFCFWIPAFAGMTEKRKEMTENREEIT